MTGYDVPDQLEKLTLEEARLALAFLSGLDPEAFGEAMQYMRETWRPRLAQDS